MYYVSGTGRDGPSAGRRLRHLHAVPGGGSTATEIVPAAAFHYAEPYHQQYLGAIADGYRWHAASDVPSRRQLQSSVVSGALV